MSFKKYQKRIAMEALENVDVPIIVDTEDDDDTGTETATGEIKDIETTLQTVADTNAGLDDSVANTVPAAPGAEVTAEVPAVAETTEVTEPVVDPVTDPAVTEPTTTVVSVPVAEPAPVVDPVPPVAVAPTPTPAPAAVAPAPTASGSPVDAAVQAAVNAASTAPAGSEIKVSVTQGADGTVTAHVEIESDDDDDDVPEALPEDEAAEIVDEAVAEDADEFEETEVAMESLRLQALALNRVAAMEGVPEAALKALSQNIDLQYRSMGLSQSKAAMEAYQLMSEPAMESFFSRIGDEVVVGSKVDYGNLINFFQTRKTIAAKYIALSNKVEAEYNSVKGGLKDIEVKIGDMGFSRHYTTKKGSITDPVAANRKEAAMINYVLGTYVEACLKQAETAVAALKVGSWEKLPQVLTKLETLKTPIELFNRSLYGEKFMSRSSFSENPGHQRAVLLLDGKGYEKLAKLASANSVSFDSDWRQKVSGFFRQDIAAKIGGAHIGLRTGFHLRTGDAATLLKINKEIAGNLEKFADQSSRAQLVKKTLEELNKTYVGGTGDQKALLKQAIAVARISLNAAVSLGASVSKQASQDLRYSTYLVQRIIYAAKANAKPTDPDLK